MNKQKLTLFILLILLVLAVIWSVVSFPRQKTADSRSAAGQAPRVVRVKTVAVAKPQAVPAKPAEKPVIVSDERVLRLDLLEREQSGFKGYRRNLFKPVFTDEIKLMKQKASAIKPVPVPPVAVAAPVPVPVQSVAVQPESHQSTLAHFTYLGFLKKDNRKTIFLSKDKEIVLVRKGERFAKRYEATEITEQTLKIKVIDSGEEIVIPLAENMPLTLAGKK